MQNAISSVIASALLPLTFAVSAGAQSQPPQFTISTVAGNGTSGYSGDGGPAIQASFNGPWGVAVDREENVYIPDFYNNRVRKLFPDGTITTVAGTGVRGFSGDKGPATDAMLYSPNRVALDPAGNLYISDGGNLRVRKVSSRDARVWRLRRLAGFRSGIQWHGRLEPYAFRVWRRSRCAEEDKPEAVTQGALGQPGLA